MPPHRPSFVRLLLLVAGVLIIAGCAAAPSLAADAVRPNVLLICVDDLRPELASFGQSYVHSPHIDALAKRGRPFFRHYVQAPTCGASRYTLLTGRYGPNGNTALFKRSQTGEAQVPSLPGWFRGHGYTTVSVGKVSHHPGGLGGPDWNDTDQVEMPGAWDRSLMPAGEWQHPRGAMHGLANGHIRGKKKSPVYEAAPGDDNTYPDGLITEAALAELRGLAHTPERPFFLTVGLIRPHLPFGAPARYLEHYRGVQLPPVLHPQRPEGKTTWSRSGEFRRYDLFGKDPNTDPDFAQEVRRHYAACVSYADAQVGRIMAALAASPAADNTVVVVWGDHGWHLGEQSVWGKHTLFESSLRSPLIVCAPAVKQPGTPTPAVVETVDVFPTLCDLAGLPAPDLLSGTSLRPQLADPAAPGGVAAAYHGNAQTLRNDAYRLVAHGDGHHELYDMRTAAGESENLAEAHPDLVQELTADLKARLAGRFHLKK